MSYLVTTALAGVQPIAEASPTQQHPVGMLVKAVDSEYGEGEFVYCQGVNGALVGDVMYLSSFPPSATARITVGGRSPLAVAMSAAQAGQWGWYQVGGAAVVRATTVLAGGSCHQFATTGAVDDAGGAGSKLDGMRLCSADGTPAAGFAVVQASRPNANGTGL